MSAFVIGITSPQLLNYPFQCWILLGQALGFVNSKIIFGLIYILVLLPIAFVMRLTGYDPLQKKRKGEKTYRENRQLHKTDFTRIF